MSGQDSNTNTPTLSVFGLQKRIGGQMLKNVFFAIFGLEIWGVKNLLKTSKSLSAAPNEVAPYTILKMTVSLKQVNRYLLKDEVVLETSKGAPDTFLNVTVSSKQAKWHLTNF